MKAVLIGTMLLAVPLAAQEFDLLIRGGHMIDPKNGIDKVADVAVSGAKVAEVAAGIDPKRAKKVVEAKGLYVVPGLVDIHTHVYTGANGRVLAGGDSSVPADMHSFRAGVTTVVDAGSSGWRNFPDFRDRLIRKSRTRVLAMLNIAGGGMGGKNEQEVADYDADATAKMAMANKDLVVGIKTAHWAAPDWVAVEGAMKAATKAGLPVMVDFGIIHIERPHRDLFLDKLRPGDIYTHMFRPFDPMLDEQGQLRPYYRTARQRGIIFDVGHGSGSLVFKWAVPAMRQGFVPDTISTDLHTGSANGGMKTMLSTMSKFLNMGMSLKDVIQASTWRPARAIRHEELGHLSVGSEADIAVLRHVRGQFGFLDVGGSKMAGTEMLECELTVRAGRVAWDLNGLAAEPWEKSAMKPVAYAPGRMLWMQSPPAGEARPAILWIHGGGWSGGKPDMFFPHVEQSAARGYVAASMQYRLGNISDAVEDAGLAFRFLEEHAQELGIDPQRIIVAGDSAGGHLALAIGTVLGLSPHAIVAYNPVSDLTGKWSSKTGTQAEARRLSPLLHIRKNTPPVLLLHGDADTVIALSDSQQLAARLESMGVPHKLVIYNGSQHAFAVPGYTAKPAEVSRALDDTFSWLTSERLVDGTRHQTAIASVP